MTWIWLRQLDAQLRAFVPFLTALLAAMLDQLPLPGSGFEAVGSFITLGVVYFWSLYRPDLLTPIAAFAAGLVYDALAGLPPGATPLLLLLVRNLMVTQQRLFLARPFLVIWACFMLLAPVAMGLRWLIACLWWGYLFGVTPVLFELALTIALYPAVSWVLSRIHSHVPRLIYAP